MKKCNCKRKARNIKAIQEAKLTYGNRITNDMTIALHTKGCPQFFCPSTHGGAGYTAGDRIENGKVICAICGAKSEIRLSALGNHVQGASEYKESLKPKKKFLGISYPTRLEDI